MHLADLYLTESISLTEAIGNLSQLNLGPMINLLRQRASPGSKKRNSSITSDQNKWVAWGIGADSEIVDIGVIKKGISSIKQAYKQAGGSAHAFALYVNDKAVLFSVATDSQLSSKNEVTAVTYDLSMFSDILNKKHQEKMDNEPSDYYRARMPRTSPTELTTTHDEEKSHYDYTLQKSVPVTKHYTGTQTSTSSLISIIDNITELAKEIGGTLTCKLVLHDMKGQTTRQARAMTRMSLQTGILELSSRLKKYKNSKKPSANNIKEFLQHVLNKTASVIQFAGSSYKTEIRPTGDFGKITPESLLLGGGFSVEYASADPDNYCSVSIKYSFDKTTNILEPYKATWTDTTTKLSMTGIFSIAAYMRVDVKGKTKDADGRISTTSDVLLNHFDGTTLSYKFGKVGGDFEIMNSAITSLENGPVEVVGNVNVSDSKLTSLQFMPKIIGGYFICKNTEIKDPYDYRFALMSQIGGEIFISDPMINDILNDYKNDPSKNHIAIDALMEYGESLGFKYD